MNDSLLNGNLDQDALNREYTQASRIRIRNILKPEIAEELHECLTNRIPWKLAYMDGNKTVTLDWNQANNLTLEDKAAIQRKIFTQASSGFQFIYNHYSLFNAYKAGSTPCRILDELVDYLCSQHFINFARAVTGDKGVSRIDVQAARYAQGHFLSRHDDHQDPARRIAFVFNLSKNWNTDWGGLTLFYDQQNNLTGSFSPLFNSLTMFRVPVSHSVTYIAPYAATVRLSITGWLLV